MTVRAAGSCASTEARTRVRIKFKSVGPQQSNEANQRGDQNMTTSLKERFRMLTQPATIDVG